MARRFRVLAVALAAVSFAHADTKAPPAGELATATASTEATAYCSSTCTPSQQIVGCDDRTVKDDNIDSRMTPPWSFTGRFDGGSQCSGTLIADKFVLTAAHCMVNQGNAQLGFALAQEVQAFAGRPYGTHGVRRLYIPQAFANTESENDRAYDYTVAELWVPIAGATPAVWGYSGWSILKYVAARSVGYPKVQPDGGFLGRAWFTGPQSYLPTQPFAWLDGGEAGLLYTNLDGNGGQSGSPAYSFVKGQRKVIGVFIGSSPAVCRSGQTWVARLTPSAVEHINNTMAANTFDFFWDRIDLLWSPTVGPGETWPRRDT